MGRDIPSVIVRDFRGRCPRCWTRCCWYLDAYGDTSQVHEQEPCSIKARARHFRPSYQQSTPPWRRRKGTRKRRQSPPRV